MEKTIADKKIFEYKDKIFGFAMEKMRNINQAEELASDIIYEVYRSFLRADSIDNCDGYVYRIARNVWAQYIHKLETGRRFESIQEGMLASPVEEEDDGMAEVLRREIGYLSKRQRIIIYMHYYEKLSVAEIADRLNLSPGTVKWHLSDARTKLKVGMDMERNEQNLEVNPIKFVSMGHGGHAGESGDTHDMFDTRLKQNIAWACYHQPRTLEEIAREVGVPQVYVADNLEKLVDFAYIDRLDSSKNPKYQTNMVLTDLRLPDDGRGQMFDDAANILCEKYIPEIFEEFERNPDHWGMTCDGDDINFLKYHVAMMAILSLEFTDTGEEFKKISVKRPDGGDFIAFASVEDDKSKKYNREDNPYWVCGYMERSEFCEKEEECRQHREDAFASISLDCRFADRSGDWRNNLESDWESLAKFINKGKDSLRAEEYKCLCDKGYLYQDRVQPVVVRTTCKEGATLHTFMEDFTHHMIKVPEEIVRLAEDTDQRMRKLNQNVYPKHMWEAVQLMSTDNLGVPDMVPRVIEKLLEKGLLEPITEVQKKAVLSILFLQE